jgi:hypothetical protein
MSSHPPRFTPRSRTTWPEAFTILRPLVRSMLRPVVPPEVGVARGRTVAVAVARARVVAVAVARAGAVGVGVALPATTSENDCAGPPVQAHCWSWTPSAVETPVTSRHLPLCRFTKR